MGGLRVAHDAVPPGAVHEPHAVPILSSVYGDYEFYVGGQRFDLGHSARVVDGRGLAAVAGLNTRRLLHRHRLSRPQPPPLVPKLKRPPSTGLFIAFEGVEGAGKGTQIRLAEEYLRDQVPEGVLVTREPGGTELGEKIERCCSTPRRASSMHGAKRCCSQPPAQMVLERDPTPFLAEGRS